MQISVALRHYILSTSSRYSEKGVFTLLHVHGENHTPAPSVNINPLFTHRHGYGGFFGLDLMDFTSLTRNFFFPLLTALILTLPGKKRTIRASIIINCLWL